MAAHIGLSWRALQPFVASLRRFAPCAVLVVLLGKDASADLLQKLLWYRAHPLIVSEEWPYTPRERLLDGWGSPGWGFQEPALNRLFPRRDLRAAKPADKVAGGILSMRFLIADALLEQASGESHRRGRDRRLILVADSTDVVFQADPFGNLALPLRGKADYAWVFEEHPTRTIGRCHFSHVVLQQYNTRLRWSLRNRTVVNSGAVLASVSGISALAEAFREVLLRYPKQDLNDQGLLTVLAYGALPLHSASRLRLEVKKHGDPGPVNNVGAFLTVGYFEHYDPVAVKLRRNADGLVDVLGIDGLPSPVLHQYDRDNMLKTLVLERWVYEENWYQESLAPVTFNIIPAVHLTDVGVLKDLNTYMSNFYSKRHCRDPSCCLSNWKQREIHLMERSGLEIRHPHLLHQAVKNCQTMENTMLLGFVFDMQGILQNWSRRNMTHRERLKLGHFWMDWQRILAAQPIYNGPSHLGPLPFQPRAAAMAACIDVACLEAEKEQPWQLVKVLWNVFIAGLGFNTKVQSYLLGARPSPDRLWSRQILWTDPSTVYQRDLNLTEVLQRARLKRLPRLDQKDVIYIYISLSLYIYMPREKNYINVKQEDGQCWQQQQQW